MSFFKKLEEKAVRNYDKINNPDESISNKMIKKREGDFENIQVETLIKEKNPKDNYNNSRYKDDRFLEDDYFDFDNPYNNSYGNPNDDFMNLYPAQKPESFHFFILENQYQDLERLIRGVKDVWDKDAQKWVIKRKAEHCFIDEESEEIVRTAQSHLSSDIKLAIFSRDEYPLLMQGIYQQLWILFKEIMDYRFGRFGDVTKQLKMKQQAVNIFNVLMMRIKANYSRAVEGRENRETHSSVKGQESLQQTDRKEFSRNYT